VIVLTVVEEEFTAAQQEFGAWTEVLTGEAGLACWAPEASESDVYGVLVTQSIDRSNVPAHETTKDLIEDWRPEVVVLVGIAGAIVQASAAGLPEGALPGDLICVEFVHYAAYAKRVAGRRQPRYFALQHPDTHLITSSLRPLSRTSWHTGLSVVRPESERSEPKVYFGEIVALEFLAGDGDAGAQQEVLSGYDHALGVDMESGGVARAMHTASRSVHYRPVWLGIRAVSDRTAADPDGSRALGRDNDSERVEWRPYAAASASRFARVAVARLLAHDREQWSDPGAPRWISALATGTDAG
jgi:nucleoside phosphorylase